MKKIAFIFFCFFAFTVAYGADKSAYEIVAAADRFTIGGVGYAGALSNQEVAFRKLLQQSDAGPNFAKLLTSATKEGQLYALLGFKLIGSPRYDQELSHFLADKNEIATMSGCLVLHRRVSSIARDIKTGRLK